MQEDLQQMQAKLRDEITVLRQQKIQFETSFRELIATYLNMMDDNDREQAD